ncbi:MAG: hypothetical protein JWM90_2622 [Thermoleophilia bacterium]|nr:hypothetical protein [Thermoleophilia bacterium]
MGCLTPRPPKSIEARIAAATVPGFPIATRSALRAAGVDRDAVRRRLQEGRLHQVLPDTFLVGVDPRAVPRDTWLRAAVARGGDASMLDGTSALERHMVWDRHDGRIHVATPLAIAPEPRLGLRFHRLPTQRLVGTELDGIPTRGIIDAVFSAARELTAHQLAYVIWRAEYRHHVTLDQLDAELTRRHGDSGTARLRAAIELRRQGSVGTKSRSEDLLLPLLTQAFGTPLVNVRGCAGIVGYEPDNCYPLVRWIIEVDGGHHVDDPQTVELDRVRDEILRAAGWRVDRITWHRVHHDATAVMRELRRGARCVAP